MIIRYLTPTNTAPTVSAWPNLPSGTLYKGTYFTVNATGSDVDGNLSNINVELSTNGGAWTAFAYHGAGDNGGDGYGTTTNANGVTSGNAGTTYQFRAMAIDSSSANSGWQYTSVYTVANSVPTVSAWPNLPPSPLPNWTYFVVSATGSDIDGNLTNIDVDVSVDGGTWTAFAYHVAGANGGDGYSTTTNANGITAGVAGTTYKFRAKAQDGSGAGSSWVESALYTVTSVNTAPIITSESTHTAVTQGQTATFTVTAVGTPTPTYQWRKNGVNISGETSSTLSITNAQPADEGNYDAVITNSEGSVTSTVAVLTINITPAITTQPVSKTVSEGDPAVFTVIATGTPTPTYQWRKNSTNITGATGSTFSISPTEAADAGNYDVVITNAAGSVTSSAAALTVLTVPAITTQPSNTTKDQGETATFTVVATGNPAPTYQWRKDGTDIINATSATLTLTNVETADEANYDVVIKNSEGSVTSNTAILAVDVPPPAVGGTVTEVDFGGSIYRVHTFTSGGTFTVSDAISADLVIVGGGGGGATQHAGGGGAGGVLVSNSQTMAPGTYTITVGAGGLGNTGYNNSPFYLYNGQAGSNSSVVGSAPATVLSLSAIGGGEGGEHDRGW